MGHKLFVERVTFDGETEESRFLSKPEPRVDDHVLVRTGSSGGLDRLGSFTVVNVIDRGGRKVYHLKEHEGDEVLLPV